MENSSGIWHALNHDTLQNKKKRNWKSMNSIKMLQSRGIYEMLGVLPPYMQCLKHTAYFTAKAKNRKKHILHKLNEIT